MVGSRCPGLRAVAPIRGLKARLPEAGLTGHNAELFLDWFLLISLWAGKKRPAFSLANGGPEWGGG